MTSTIDDLLDNAAIPIRAADSFDVSAALRRLAEDAAHVTPTPEIERAARAGQHLAVISRWILNSPGAATAVDQLADDPSTAASAPVEEKQLDVDGAAVFACLLFLTGHPESAQFWWQLAAGAGHRAAAYCLYLHHLALGEVREARHWRHEVTHTMALAPIDSSTPEEVLEGLELVAHIARRTGSTTGVAPTGGLEMEVDRLAEESTHSCIIVRRPDRRLADQLADSARR